MIKTVDTTLYMSAKPVTFTPDTDIFDAIHTLLELRLSGATVVNDQNEVIGVISELDCLKAIINVGYYSQGGGTVADFMYSGDIQFMPEQTNIVDAAQTLINSSHRRMPLQHDGKFAGQISARSLLQAFTSWIADHEGSEGLSPGSIGQD